MMAGMDVEQPMQSCYNDELEDWFRAGKADMSILNTLVERILTAKFEMGLFESPYALTGEEFKKYFYDERDLELSLQSARESLVLMKNDGILPLKNVHKIAVIGPHADRARILFGGYTHYNLKESFLMHMNTMAGVDKNIKDGEMKTYPGCNVERDDDPCYDELQRQLKPGMKSVLEEMRAELGDCEIVFAQGYPKAGNDTSGFAEALAIAKDADVIILTVGGKYGSGSVSTMGEGVDSTDINLAYCQEEFIKEAAKLNIPMVALHFNGRPISSDAADQYCNAILECFVPSEAGAQAIVEVLTGKVNPSGKLPVSVAYNAGQIPVYYNHPNGSGTHQSISIGFPNYMDLPHAPRYPFGFGLSYTNFTYSNLTLEPNEEQAKVTVKFDITNTGDCKGTEVVQLYFEDSFASMVRPCMELAGFKRVELEKGETKTIRFELNYSQFAFLDEDMNWLVEAGEFKLYVAASSEDIRLQDAFRVEKSSVIDGKTRGFYALGEEV